MDYVDELDYWMVRELNMEVTHDDICWDSLTINGSNILFKICCADHHSSRKNAAQACMEKKGEVEEEDKEEDDDEEEEGHSWTRRHFQPYQR